MINSANIANGTIHYPGHSENISEIEWVEHPKFKGVYLKHLIKGANTNGQFSSHLVKIDPNCSLDTHCHEEQWELHEVIEGQGVCNLIEETVSYHRGKIAVIPKGANHKVQASNNGLTLFAKFIPALL
jgi:quercetin dioxygenase-like cupin family protein